MFTWNLKSRMSFLTKVKETTFQNMEEKLLGLNIVMILKPLYIIGFDNYVTWEEYWVVVFFIYPTHL